MQVLPKVYSSHLRLLRFIFIEIYQAMDHFKFNFNSMSLFIHFLFHPNLFQNYLHPQLRKVNHFGLLNLLTMCFHKLLENNFTDFLIYQVIILDYNLN